MGAQKPQNGVDDHVFDRLMNQHLWQKKKT
jgi:hypothetical protein